MCARSSGLRRRRCWEEKLREEVQGLRDKLPFAGPHRVSSRQGTRRPVPRPFGAPLTSKLRSERGSILRPPSPDSARKCTLRWGSVPAALPSSPRGAHGPRGAPAPGPMAGHRPLCAGESGPHLTPLNPPGWGWGAGGAPRPALPSPPVCVLNPGGEEGKPGQQEPQPAPSAAPLRSSQMGLASVPGPPDRTPQGRSRSSPPLGSPGQRGPVLPAGHAAAEAALSTGPSHLRAPPPPPAQVSHLGLYPPPAPRQALICRRERPRGVGSRVAALVPAPAPVRWTDGRSDRGSDARAARSEGGRLPAQNQSDQLGAGRLLAQVSRPRVPAGGGTADRGQAELTAGNDFAREPQGRKPGREPGAVPQSPVESALRVRDGPRPPPPPPPRRLSAPPRPATGPRTGWAAPLGNATLRLRAAGWERPRGRHREDGAAPGLW